MNVWVCVGEGACDGCMYLQHCKLRFTEESLTWGLQQVCFGGMHAAATIKQSGSAATQVLWWLRLDADSEVEVASLHVPKATVSGMLTPTRHAGSARFGCICICGARMPSCVTNMTTVGLSQHTSA